MKKINKYSNDSFILSFSEEMRKYRKASRLFREQPNQKKARKSSPLSLIIPFAAASLSPFAIGAQCGNAVITVGGDVGQPGEHLIIDIDGDGTVDIHLDSGDQISNPALADLFVHLENPSAEVLAYPGYQGPNKQYYYASRLASMDVISSANANWERDNLPVGNFLNLPYATLDYQANGPWHGTGIEVGFIAIRLNGNQLGFVEVTWHNTGLANVDVSATTMGVQSSSQASNASIPAGNCSVLPVELVSFTGRIQKGNSELRWTTASEENNKGFEIERSINGRDFEKLHFIEGNGTTSQLMHYQFVDKNIEPNTLYYYRLNQIDYDGANEYSNLISMEYINVLATKLGISPNPASERIQIRFEGKVNSTVQFDLYDLQGSLVKQNSIFQDSETINFDMNIEDLPSGTYFLKVEHDLGVEYQKFIKQRN